MTTGVYRIACSATGRCYIGATRNIEQRWYTHKTQLRAGQHYSKRFQADWDTHGADAFALSIIEVVTDRAQLREREIHHIHERAAQAAEPDYHTIHGAGLGLKSRKPAENRERVLALLASIEATGETATLRDITRQTDLSIMMVRRILLKAGLWTPERVAAAKRRAAKLAHTTKKGRHSARNRTVRVLQEKWRTIGTITAYSAYLSPRQRDVVQRRFGQGLTMQETADQLGISRERVRQLEDQAIQNIKDVRLSEPMRYEQSVLLVG